ncbi:MAG: tetratricopeptide repeat protein [Muribaculaceae bacterium]|nr:tetratricopeptide repeat protein [Muribaculaceae bacterium]MDE7081565.1 tetratricopeptide repeat protein [Muribaculaceae bacterium]
MPSLDNTEYLKQALKLISGNSLHEAISLVRQYAAEQRLSDTLDALQQIEQSYSFMLRYLAEGAPDPAREKLFCDLSQRLYAITANLLDDRCLADDSSLYASTRRSVRFSNLNFADALGRYISADASLQLAGVYGADGKPTEAARQLLNEKDRALKDIFSYLWTLPVATSTRQLEPAVNVAVDSDIAYGLRTIIVSALVMGLLGNYDPAKLTALLDIEERTADQRIRAHALVGVVLALEMHRKLAEDDPMLQQRFASWLPDPSNYLRLREVIYAIVKTQGSLLLADKIQHEIIPGLNTLGKDFLKNINIDKDRPISIDELQANPEWERLMRESGIEKKLRRLHDMQEKGADMMLPMYGQLSSHFFFKDIDTWFRAFEPWEAARIGLHEHLIDILARMPNTAMMCDTDKYALVLNLSRLPQGAKDMMTGAFDAGSEEMKVDFDDMSLHSDEPDFDLEVINYARVLFRFFNYFRLRREFKNPFDGPLGIITIPFIGSMMSEDEILHTLGETYFHQGNYEDAAEIYQLLIEREDTPSSLLLQKLGYCYEKDDSKHDALECYMKADSLTEDTDVWLLRRIRAMAEECYEFNTEIDALDRLIDAGIDLEENIPMWLDMMLKFNVDDHETMEKRLSRLKYMAPDAPSTLSLSARFAFACKDYRKAIEILSARRADIEMMLAASSLGSTAAEDTPDIDELSEMSDDLLLLACAHAAEEEYAEAVQLIRRVVMLDPERYTHSVLSSSLRQFWQNSPRLESRRTLLPLLVEAALI